MDIMTLSKTTFLPVKLVEGYTSCVWTERHLAAGEFVMVTPLVAQHRALMPLDSLLTHKDTYEVMIVETHSIAEDDNGVKTLTISGRSFETFLENRVAAVAIGATTDANNGEKYSVIANNTALAVRYFTRDLIVTNPPESSGDFTTSPLSSSDTIPDIEVYPSGGTSAEVETENASFLIELGDLWTQATQMLSGAGRGYGIRNTRPVPGGITPRLWIQIHKGLDRTTSQSTNAPVVLRVDADHFTGVSYLFSHRGYKNTAYVFSPLGAVIVYRGAAQTGLNRRVLYVDASDVTSVPSSQTWQDVLTKRGRKALGNAENKATTVFDGKVSPTIPYRYRTDYALGDLVTVVAEYGITMTMMVNEYIRSQDDTGDTGYPALVDPTAATT